MEAEDGAGAAGLRQQAKRLATLAGLAKPVQHEINNLLTVIFANLEMLKRTAAEGAPQRQLDRIAEAARRFEASTRAILSLSRRPVPGAGEVRLPEALTQLRALLLVLMPAPGLLTLEVAEDGWPVLLDRAALDEALIALAREAAGVLPRGGRLALGTADRPGPPDMVELSVRWPAEVALPSLATLRALVEAAGGRAEEGEAEGGALLLRLLLPRRAAGG